MLKIDLIKHIEHEANDAICLYVYEIKDHVKGLEFQLKREIIEKILIV